MNEGYRIGRGQGARRAQRADRRGSGLGGRGEAGSVGTRVLVWASPKNQQATEQQHGHGYAE